MSETELDPVRRLEIDPDGPPLFVAVHGRKGSGKSEFLKRYARSWPYDALIVDPTGDLDPDGSWTRPWPGGNSWPEPDPDADARIGHRRFRIKPNRREKDHREKVDAAVLAAHDHDGPTLIVIDEGRYLFASDEAILSGSDIVQNEGRHGQDFVIIANPRAIGLRPIYHSQADWIVLFDTPGEEDLKRVAGPAGLDWRELQRLVAGLDRQPIGAHGEVVTGFILIDIPARFVGRYPILPR